MKLTKVNRQKTSAYRLAITFFIAALGIDLSAAVERKLSDLGLIPPAANVAAVATFPEALRTGIDAAPQNVAAYAGRTAQLNCEATDPSPISRVMWWEYVTGSGTGSLVSDNTFITPGHPNAARYKIIQGFPTQFILEISNLTLADGGTYVCMDSNAAPPGQNQGQAELVVLGDVPQCMTTVHDDGAVLEGQNYTNSCNVSYQGGLAPIFTWSGPEPFRGPIDATTDTDVASGIGYTVQRSFDTGAYRVLMNFTTMQSPPDTAADNAPTLFYIYQFRQLYAYWAPTNMDFFPRQIEYIVGDVLTCNADAYPTAGYKWQNLVTLLEVYGPSYTILTADRVGNLSLRCEATNIVQGFAYVANLFIAINVPPLTTTPEPTTASSTTLAPPDAPCTDLSGWWISADPYAELRIQRDTDNDDFSTTMIGFMRNYTDSFWVETVGTVRLPDYSYIGLTLIWPPATGITSMTGECHRCFGVEVIFVDTILRSITDSSGCGDGGNPRPDVIYKFERDYTIGPSRDLRDIKVWRPTQLVSGKLGLDIQAAEHHL